jgi:hypothetical protein
MRALSLWSGFLVAAAAFLATAHVAAASSSNTGCNVPRSNDLTFALFDGSKSVPDAQFATAVNTVEQAYVANVVNAKEIPDLMIGTFGSTARQAMQGLPRLTLQNVRNYERPVCAKTGLAVMDTRLVNDREHVRSAAGSAILEALYHAGGYLHSSTGHERLFVYSDMLEQSNWLTFGKNIATPKARSAAIAGLAKSGHIADLKGVTVCLVGFDAGSVPSLQPAAVTSFWQEYFRKSGATLGFIGTDFPTSGSCTITTT